MPIDVVTTSYGRPALDALADAVRAAKGGMALAPVTVVVPTNAVGVAARRALARPAGIAAVSFVTTLRLAELLAAPTLAGRGRRPATTPVLVGTLRQCLLAAPGRFASVATHPSTIGALLATHRELRDLPEPALVTLAADGSPRTREVLRLHRAAQARLTSGGWYDEADLLTEATALVTTGHPMAAALGHVIVHLPQAPSLRATALLQAVARHGDMTVVLGRSGSSAADAAPLGFAERLGADMSRATAGASPAARSAGAVHVVSAPDADDEVRQALSVLFDAARASEAPAVALERMAVLYPSPEPYARILAEQLDAAGIRWHGRVSRPLRERAAGRAVLGLLGLHDHGLRRTEVIGLLADTNPMRRAGQGDPVAAWERISRAAGVVGGLADWTAKLDQFALQADARADRLADDPDGPSSPHQALRREATLARRLNERVVELAEAFDPASAPHRWDDLSHRAQSWLRRLLGPESDQWPDDEAIARQRVEAALDRLSHLDAVDPEPDIEVFRAALDAELDGDLGRRGRIGEGVHVGALGSTLGLDVDVVVVLGMAEASLPTLPRPDPLLPDDQRAFVEGLLPRSDDRQATELRNLLAAMAGVGLVVFSRPRGDLRRSSGRVPSRWLALATPVDREIEVPSFHGAMANRPFPVTLQDHHLRSLGEHLARAGRADHHPLAASGTAFAHGAALVAARAGNDFTAYDGNLAGMALASPFGPEPSAATRLEAWVRCPHAYLMGHVLRVRPVEEPEQLDSISPRDRGSLVHEVLERFVVEAMRRRVGRSPEPDQAWDAADHAQLDDLLTGATQRSQAAGRSGPPLYWPGEVARLRRDLHDFLDDDSHRRAARGCRPLGVEVAFGDGDAWPAVEVPTPHGTVAFRGRIDRIDLGEDGCLYVTDLKTGTGSGFKGVSQDTPLGPGNDHLQLAVYARAARRAHPEATKVVAELAFVGGARNRTITITVDDAVDTALEHAVDTIALSMEAGVFPPHPSAPVWSPYVVCPYCDPDGNGTAGRYRVWERKRHHPALAPYTTLIGEVLVTAPVATAEEVVDA